MTVVFCDVALLYWGWKQDAMESIQECFERLTESVQGVLEQRGECLQSTLGEVAELAARLQLVRDKTARVRQGIAKLHALSVPVTPTPAPPPAAAGTAAETPRGTCRP